MKLEEFGIPGFLCTNGGDSGRREEDDRECPEARLGGMTNP